MHKRSRARSIVFAGFVAMIVVPAGLTAQSAQAPDGVVPMPGARADDPAADLERAQRLLNERRHAEAVAPARRAVAAAGKSGGASGVDPQVAQLTLARAELRGDDREAMARLEQLLEKTPYSPDLGADLQAAALDLALYADERGDLEVAARAWTLFRQLLQARPRPDPIWLARAYIGEAAARIQVRVQRGNESLTARQDSPQDAFGAYASLLVKAAALVEEPARQWVADFEPTPAQRLYALALAWLGALESKFRTENTHRVPGVVDGAGAGWQTGDPADPRPACKVRLVTEPAAEFPPSERQRDRIGAVVVKLRFDEQGKVVDSAVAASVGGAEFKTSVATVAPRWRIERVDPVAGEDCRMARDYFQKVHYILR